MPKMHELLKIIQSITNIPKQVVAEINNVIAQSAHDISKIVTI